MSEDPEVTDPRDPYKRPDIVTELDRQLLHWHEPMLERARDEIVALRNERNGYGDALQQAREEIVALRKLTDGDWVWKQITDTRAEALEEAARECDEEAKGSGGEVAFRDGCETCAAAIRLLKGKGQ